MDLKSLTQELKKLLSHINAGTVTPWEIVRVIVYVLQFVLQFADQDPADGRITFGAAPLDTMEFQEMVDQVCTALGAPPTDELAMGGVGDRLAEFALAKLGDAIRLWMLAQGYSNVWDLIAALLHPPAAATE